MVRSRWTTSRGTNVLLWRRTRTNKNYLSIKDITYIKISYKLLKLLLSNIGIINKQIRIGTERVRVYVINKTLIKQLEDEMGLQEDIEVFNDDDFEISNKEILNQIKKLIK